MFRRTFLTNFYYKELYSITSDRIPQFRIKTKNQKIFGLRVNYYCQEAHLLATTLSLIILAKVAALFSKQFVLFIH